MADRAPAPDTPELRERWGSFAWTAENAAKAKAIVARYPEGRQRSAVMPLLFLALGALVLDASVLGALALLFLAFAGLVLAGAVPTLGLSLGLVLAGYVRRLRGRWRMWSRHQAGEL